MVTNVFDHSEVPYYILEKASQDKFLPGLLKIDKDDRRVIIRHQGIPVGFYTPKQTVYEGQKYWRTGAIYILPEYRGKAIASNIAINFFKYKEYCLAFINCDNEASISCYTKAGLIKVAVGIGKISGAKLFVMLKRPVVVVSPMFLNW